jgi:ATP-dependent Clp protease ATP-binding subunit ClpC
MNGSLVFERFTDRARIVMAVANQESQRYQNEYIDTEHILIGLVREGGVASRALKYLGAEPKMVRQIVDELVTIGPEGTPFPDPLLPVPRAKQVILYACEEARHLGHDHVGTEHLLLGLLREETGVGGKVLNRLGITPEAARAAISKIYSEHQRDVDDWQTPL